MNQAAANATPNPTATMTPIIALLCLSGAREATGKMCGIIWPGVDIGAAAVIGDEEMLVAVADRPSIGFCELSGGDC